jgi:hypothetical protein
LDEAQSRRFGELTREDRAARSTAFIAAVNSLSVSDYVLSRNFVEVVAIVEAFDRDPSLTNLDRRGDANSLHREFVRRLHNYLAAVKMLIDHVRALRRRWPHPAFDSACDGRITALVSEPVVKFVQDLRHPTLHSRLPDVARVTTFRVGVPVTGGPSEETRLMVDVSDLHELHDWSKPARLYIAENAPDGKLDLGVAVRRHQEHVSAFNKWFTDGVREAHADLIADFDARRAEIRRLLRSDGVAD